jgi:signal transduction histidine kinase
VPTPETQSAARLQIRSTRLWEGLLDVVSVIAVVSAVGQTEPVPPAGLVLLAVAALSLVARRRAPRLAWLVSAVAATAAGFAWPDSTWLTLAFWVITQVCLFSVALRDDRRVAAWAAGALAVALVAQSTIAQSNSVVDLLSVALITWTAAVLGAGLAVRAQREHIAALEAKTRAEAADREREVGQRLTQERLRIAQDLHDAVAHTVAVIALHAGAAEQNLRTSPDDSAASLGAIRSAARTVVGEMQQIVQLLRDEGEPREARGRTVPGMAAVPDLLRSVRASGVQVSYTERIVTGEHDGAAQHNSRVELSQVVDVTVFRILQEGLTNAVRYGDGRVEASVVLDDQSVTVRVVNQHGPSPEEPGRAGFGLVGMRERVSAAGGHLSVGDTEQGFEVVADLPIESARPSA